jgi:crotonobetaine/carnitine-CoA ligase
MPSPLMPGICLIRRCIPACASRRTRAVLLEVGCGLAAVRPFSNIDSFFDLKQDEVRQFRTASVSPPAIHDYPLRERTIARVVRDKAAANGARPFLLFEGRAYSYREVDSLSNRLAHSLARLGVARGTHVAVFVDNKPEVVLTYFALGKLGAVCVPLNTAAKGAMLSYFLAQSDSEVVVFDGAATDRIAAAAVEAHRLRAAIAVGPPAAAWPLNMPFTEFAALIDGPDTAPDVEVNCFDPFMIMYTSGTTGPSKGVVIPQASVLSQAWAIAEACGYQAHDVLYTCLPLYHANAWWCSCLPALLADATVAISRRFSASRFWSEVRQCGATQFNLLGAMAGFLWNRPPDPGDRDHRVRQAMVVPVPTEFYHAFQERFNLTLKSLYGLTDACITAIKRDDDPPLKWRSAGRPCDYVDVAIVDDDDFEVPRGTVGEIVIRPREPWIMGQGYYNLPEATAAAWRNQWLHTGDRATMDEDGYLYFVDRKKDAIRRRGENISSFEVEQIVRGCEGVLEVAAFGVRSEHSEEEVMITVVRRAGCTLSEATIVDYCTRNMSDFMVPRFVEFVVELPRNASEKIEKYKLRADAETRLDAIWDRECGRPAIRRR